MHPFQLQVLTHLEKIPKEPNRRNCACFVANGVVYTKLKTTHNKRNQPEDIFKRNKRSAFPISDSHRILDSTPAEILQLIRLNEELDRVASGLNGPASSRHKRSTEDVIDVIAEIQRNLSSLEGTFKNSTENASEKCSVAPGGHVNCSASVYEDEKSWKRSRHQIDLLIKVLKKKISDLKDIRKHLKEHKPVSIKEDYEDINSKEDEERRATGNAIKGDTDDNLGPLIDMDWYTGTPEKERETGNGTTSATTTASISTTVINDIESSTVRAASTVPATRRRASKRPQTSTAAPISTAKPFTTSVIPGHDDTKIPIFYIGEDTEEVPVKPNMTTEGPEEMFTSSLMDIVTEGIIATAFTTSTEGSTITAEVTTADPVETTVTQITSHKQHRHNHGSNGNRTHHHPHGHDHRRPGTTTDTSSGPAECYCDLENEK